MVPSLVFALVALAGCMAPGVPPAMATTGQQAPASGFDACPQFFADGVTPRASADLAAWKPRALCYEAFAILHSGATRTPIFVAQRLSRESLADAADEERTDRFFEDARLPRAERATLLDYRGSGYDRGHMAPAADMPTASAMAQSFSLANMVPQAPQNNRKVWSKIERDTRHYARRAKGPIYVLTGPVFDREPRAIGPNQVYVPRYLYKLVYDPASGRAWAHWLENLDTATVGRPISYEELVSRTGIEFLPALRDAH